MAKTTSNRGKSARRSAPVDSVVGLAEALAEIVRESGAVEMKLDGPQHSLRMRRRKNAAPQVVHTAATVTNNGTSSSGASSEEDYLTPITSQHVGTLRLLHPKTGKSMVSVGDTVEPNQCLGWVEAMGMRHDLPAPRAGTVVEVLAEAGDPVEFGQVLILIQ